MLGALLSQSLAVGLTRACGVVLAAFVTILIARMLGPEGLGTYTFGIIVISIGLIPVGNGWGLLTLRATVAAVESTDWSGVRGMIERSVLYAVLCTILVFGVGVVFTWPSDNRWSLCALIAAILLADQISAVRSHYLRGLNRPVLALLPEAIVRPITTVMFIGMFRLFFREQVTVWYAFVSLLAGAVTAFLVGIVLAHRASSSGMRASASRYQDNAWLLTAGILALSSGLSVVHAYVDVLLLGAFASLTDVGIYRVAKQIANLGAIGYAALNLVAARQFSKFREKGDVKGAQSVATLLCLLALSASLALPAVLLFGGSGVIATIFGSEFEPAFESAMVLALGQVICSGCGMCNVLLLMNHHEHLVVRLAAVFLLLNVTMCVVLIPLFGIMGAAWANVIATGSWNVATAIFALQHTRINASISALLPSRKLKKLKRH